MKRRLRKLAQSAFGMLALLFVASNIMVSPSKVSYGYYCGMCYDRCADIYTIEDGMLTVDTSSFFAAHYSKTQLVLKPENSTRLSNWEYENLALKYPSSCC